MTIVERTEVSHSDLIDLFENNVTAVRLPRYYSEDVVEKISEVLLGSDLHGKYENAPEIGRVGQAFFECQSSPEIAERYEREAVHWIRQLRSGLFPQLTPIDRVRLELDEAWEAGAQIAMLNGRKMFVGLARTFGRGSFAEPHQDVLRWDAPENEDAKRVTSQIAMNVYLKMPEEGGGLTIWPKSYDLDDYNAMRIEGSYGLQRSKLPEPSAVIQPRVGELILFNAMNVHAVEEIKSGLRVTWSCFIGFQGKNRPLVLWS